MHLWKAMFTAQGINKFFKRFVTAILFGCVYLCSIIFLPKFITLVLLVMTSFFILNEWFALLSKIKCSLLFTFIYPILPYASLIALLFLDKNFLIMSFVAAFAFDTGAYITGSLFGRHKMVPSISPNKSWEGFLGGVIFLFIALEIYIYFFNIASTNFHIFLISILAALIAFSGDLAESYIKRLAGVKDSGNSLPGHGGFLDRFDSIMFLSFFGLILHLLC